MARKVIVLALLLVAFVGMTSADASAEAPISDDVIGTADGSEAGAPSIDGLAAGPLGSSAVAGGDGTGAAGPAGAEAPSESDATALKVSAIAGAAMVAGYFF